MPFEKVKVKNASTEKDTWEKKKALSDFRVCQKWEREWKDGASIWGLS